MPKIEILRILYFIPLRLQNSEIFFYIGISVDENIHQVLHMILILIHFVQW